MEIDISGVDEESVKIYKDETVTAENGQVYTLIDNGFFEDDELMIEKGKAEFKCWIDNKSI